MSHWVPALALAAALSIALPAPRFEQSARTPGLTELSRSLQDLAEKVSPSVVQILVTAYAVDAERPAVTSGLPSTRRASRSEEHTSELQSQSNLVCRLLLEKKKKK